MYKNKLEGDILANEQNLKVPTSSEAREYGRRGGIASGKARREKSTMKRLLQQLLQEQVPKDKEGRTYMELATLGLIKGAVKGDSRNYKVMLETLGEFNNEEKSKDGIIVDLVEALKDVKNK